MYGNRRSPRLTRGRIAPVICRRGSGCFMPAFGKETPWFAETTTSRPIANWVALPGGGVGGGGRGGGGGVGGVGGGGGGGAGGGGGGGGGWGRGGGGGGVGSAWAGGWGGGGVSGGGGGFGFFFFFLWGVLFATPGPLPCRSLFLGPMSPFIPSRPSPPLPRPCKRGIRPLHHHHLGAR